MKIVADEQLGDVEELFTPLGDVVLLPAGDFNAEAVAGADILLVRSVTEVSRELLAGSRVRFVGTATSGNDHIDMDYLARRNIIFADAKGSNANAVVDYCMTALAHWLVNNRLANNRLEKNGLVKNGFENSRDSLSALRVGVVGYGHIGSRFAGRLTKLGYPVSLCDPPLALSRTLLSGSDECFCPLEEIAQCPVVSLHVPLTDTTAYPTRGLIGGRFLQGLPANALLINTCRGGVVDETALIRLLAERPDLTYVADVWEGEPEVNGKLVQAATIATPHIAGYSRRAKREATSRLLEAVCKQFGLRVPAGPKPAAPEVLQPAEPAASHWQLLPQALPLARVSAEFKQAVARGPEESARVFAQIREDFLKRREFRELFLANGNFSDEDRQALLVQGFHLERG